MSSLSSSRFSQLKELNDQPKRQAALALEFLRTERDKQLVAAALKLLAGEPHPPARETLIDLYRNNAVHGEINDPGGQQRAWILNALLPIAQPADSELFEEAALTYEFLPPSFKEETGLLRAAAIVGLNELDEEAAAFHAARILVENYSDPMSGEPAVTAAKVLASQEQLPLLYQYLYQDVSRLLPEVASECLRLLTSLPGTLIPGLIKRFSNSDSDLIMAGFFDLLIGHSNGPFDQEFIISFLKESKRYDLYRYLVAVIVAESRNSLLPAVLPLFKLEKNGRKVPILVEMLAPFEGDPDIAAVLDNLKRVE